VQSATLIRFGALLMYAHCSTIESSPLLMPSQAPTLQNLNNYQWAPNLISYSADTDADVFSTSYHMIELFSTHRISTTLPIANASFKPIYYVAGYSNSSDSYLLKTAVYNGTATNSLSVAFDGVSPGAKGTLTVLTAPNGTSYNKVGTDVVRKHVKRVTAGYGGVFTFELPNLSVSVLEVKA
jgi:alpha-N-arabinofuranosidase